MAFRKLGSALLLVALGSVTVTAAGCQVPRETIDVLYVGNSYIYFNNLPGLIEGISTELEGPVVRGSAHTHGGSTLQRHIADGHVADLLMEGPQHGGDWDWVVLQEQSTLGAEYDGESGMLGSPDAFHDATRDLVAMVEREGARAALYMTWAKEAFPSQSESLSQAYRSIGTELNVAGAMVGEAWAEANRRRPDFGLYVSDGSHPNAAGSYLAALVLYSVLTGESPVGAPREVLGAPWDVGGPVESAAETILVSLSASDAEFLQGVAWGVVGGR